MGDALGTILRLRTRSCKPKVERRSRVGPVPAVTPSTPRWSFGAPGCLPCLPNPDYLMVVAALRRPRLCPLRLPQWAAPKAARRRGQIALLDCHPSGLLVAWRGHASGAKKSDEFLFMCAERIRHLKQDGSTRDTGCLATGRDHRDSPRPAGRWSDGRRHRMK